MSATHRSSVPFQREPIPNLRLARVKRCSQSFWELIPTSPTIICDTLYGKPAITEAQRASLVTSGDWSIQRHATPDRASFEESFSHNLDEWIFVDRPGSVMGGIWSR